MAADTVRARAAQVVRRAAVRGEERGRYMVVSR